MSMVFEKYLRRKTNFLLIILRDSYMYIYLYIMEMDYHDSLYKINCIKHSEIQKVLNIFFISMLIKLKAMTTFKCHIGRINNENTFDNSLTCHFKVIKQDFLAVFKEDLTTVLVKHCLGVGKSFGKSILEFKLYFPNTETQSLYNILK